MHMILSDDVDGDVFAWPRSRHSQHREEQKGKSWADHEYFLVFSSSYQQSLLFFLSTIPIKFLKVKRNKRKRDVPRNHFITKLWYDNLYRNVDAFFNFGWCGEIFRFWPKCLPALSLNLARLSWRKKKVGVRVIHVKNSFHLGSSLGSGSSFTSSAFVAEVSFLVVSKIPTEIKA